jgi:hypothetical protein
MQSVPQCKLPEKWCQSHSARQKFLLIYHSSLLKSLKIRIHFMFDELKMCDLGFLVRSTP